MLVNIPEGMRRGSDLHPQDKQYVLSAFIHRFTRNHTPTWAQTAREDGSQYPVQFDNDDDWLNNTAFYIRKDGRLNMRNKSCYSCPTWPDNKGAN